MPEESKIADIETVKAFADAHPDPVTQDIAIQLLHALRDQQEMLDALIAAKKHAVFGYSHVEKKVDAVIAKHQPSRDSDNTGATHD